MRRVSFLRRILNAELSSVARAQEEVFYRVNEERFHLQWRAHVRVVPTACHFPRVLAHAGAPPQLLRAYASDLYNPHVASVLGIILDITTADTDSMAEARSRAWRVPDLPRCRPH